MKITIGDIIVWIFFILSIIFVFWYILGDSPTLEQTLLVLILGLLIANIVKTSKLETRFGFLARDFREYKEDFKDHLDRYHE